MRRKLVPYRRQDASLVHSVQPCPQLLNLLPDTRTIITESNIIDKLAIYPKNQYQEATNIIYAGTPTNHYRYWDKKKIHTITNIKINKLYYELKPVS
jgi:hypothetical protein